MTKCQRKGRLSKHVLLSLPELLSHSLWVGAIISITSPGAWPLSALPNRLNNGEVTLTEAQRFIRLQIALTLVDGSVCWRIGKQDSTNTGMARKMKTKNQEGEMNLSKLSRTRCDVSPLPLTPACFSFLLFQKYSWTFEWLCFPIKKVGK